MPIIQTVASDQASGKVAEIYRQIEHAFGHVPNALQIYNSSPAMLEQQWQSIGYYMNHAALSFPHPMRSARTICRNCAAWAGATATCSMR